MAPGTDPAVADAAIPADRRPGLDDILEKALSSHRRWEENIDPASLDRAGENRPGGCSHRSEYGFWNRDASHHTVMPGNGGRILPPGIDVIDVGCGSGILSIAAIKLGAKKALAVDIDPLSVKATQENSDANEVLKNMEIGEGSVEEILNNKYSIRSAPLVLANILAPVIIKLLSDGLAKLLMPNGILVLSGILEEQEPNVLLAADKCGLKLLQKKQMGDWVSLAMQ